jgi:hypothetical protein
MIMRRSLLLAMIVVTMALFACSDDDDGGPTGLPGDGDLQAMAECTAEGLKQLGYAIQTALILFHELEDYPPYDPPVDFHYNPLTGDFDNQYVDPSEPLGTARTSIEGTVSPLSVVEDGLHQGDIFTISWYNQNMATTDTIAAGTFRIRHMGLTLPPNQTESLQVLPADTFWVDRGGGCRTEFAGQFTLIVHHLRTDGEEVRTALADFWSMNAAADTLKGLITAGATAETGLIYGEYQGAQYQCTIDMDTYVVDCSGN